MIVKKMTKIEELALNVSMAADDLALEVRGGNPIDAQIFIEDIRGYLNQIEMLLEE